LNGAKCFTVMLVKLYPMMSGTVTVHIDILKTCVQGIFALSWVKAFLLAPNEGHLYTENKRNFGGKFRNWRENSPYCISVSAAYTACYKTGFAALACIVSKWNYWTKPQLSKMTLQQFIESAQRLITLIEEWFKQHISF